MTAETLTLREYESAAIGSIWDVDNKIVSRREVTLLDVYQRKTGKKLFDLGYRSIKATNWVGVIGIGKRCIEVIPKVDQPSEKGVRENLLYMILSAGLIPIAPADIARFSNTGKPLLVAYLDLFVYHLSREWRKGQIREYIVCEDNRSCLKGKLILPVHIRENSIHRERFFTSFDEFTCDNTISQLLKSALRVCQEQRFSGILAQKVRSLLADFDEVSDIEFNNQQLMEINVDRRTIRFEHLINMAKFIIKDVSPSPALSGKAVHSIMFDMNIVFERFVAAQMELALRSEPLRVKYQVKGKSLLLRNGRRQFALHPDLGVYDGRRNVCIIDTKWKRLDVRFPHNAVSQADIYQMYAYGKEYNSPRVVVLYPQYNNLPVDVAEYYHNEDSPLRTIEIKTLNISESLTNSNAGYQLQACLRDMVMGDNSIRNASYI